MAKTVEGGWALSIAGGSTEGGFGNQRDVSNNGMTTATTEQEHEQ
jgi:hypothetical protein